jgi:hypothetical protein
MTKLTRLDFPDTWAEQFIPAITKVRCPKCRSRNLTLTESVGWTTTWTVRDGRLNRAAGIHEPGGICGPMTAECVCGHRWNLRRGAIQITCVVEDVELEEQSPAERKDEDG